MCECFCERRRQRHRCKGRSRCVRGSGKKRHRATNGAGQGIRAGNYTASFVGVFPADKPQYVVLVKFDSPKRVFYGGEIAAPVTKVVLRAALAARDAALDRGPSSRRRARHSVDEAEKEPDAIAAAATAVDSGAPEAVELPSAEERSARSGHLIRVAFCQTRDSAGQVAAARFPMCRAILATRFAPCIEPGSACARQAAAGCRPFLRPDASAAGSIVKLQHIP